MRHFLFAIFNNLDIILAVVGACASLLLIFYAVMEYSRISYLILAILTLLSCIAWLKIRKISFISFPSEDSRSNTFFFSILFVLVLVTSILSVKFRPETYERPLIFFIVTSLMTGIIACEILYANERYKYWILSQIMVLGLNISWSQLLIFPNLIGVDPFFHQKFTTTLMEIYTIPSGTVYTNLPIFHLLIAITSILSQVNYKIATLFSISLIQIICNVLFIYILSRYVIKNHKFALFGSLMVVIASYHIQMNYASIPNSFAAIFIPIILFLIFVNNEKMSIIKISLIFLFMITLILTHTVTAMFMAILLCVLWAASKGYSYFSRTSFKLSILFPTTFVLIMFAWWSYAAGHIKTLGNLIKWGFSLDFFLSEPTQRLQEEIRSLIPLNEIIFNSIGFYLFICLSFIGVFYLFSKRDIKPLILAFCGTIPLLITFFALISGSSVIEHRWWYFAQIFLSIPLGITVGILYITLRNKSILLSIISLFLFVSIIAFLCIICPVANSDNHFFQTSYQRLSPTESELYSINTISRQYPGEIGTENYIAHIFSFLYSDIILRGIDENIYIGNYSDISTETVLVRSYIKDNPFRLHRISYRLHYDPYKKLEKAGFNHIYNSNSVSLFSNDY